MRNIVVAFLLIVVALALTKTESGSDAVRDGIRGVGSKCAVSAHRPAKQGGQVVATGEVLCDRPGPEKVTLTVQLQRSADGKQWATVAGQTYTLVGDAATSAKPAGSRRRTAGAACANTTWRTLVEWTVQDKGKTTKAGPRTSEGRKNVCG